jgi:hypothetical protein
MKEIWKDIENYEGYYQVSNLGRVRSLDRIISYNTKRYFKTGRILSVNKNKNNYYCVYLSVKGIKKMKYVHRLVAETFIKKPSGYDNVNHKDFDTYNNNVYNLEWCTQKYNVNYSFDNGRMPLPPFQEPKAIIRNDGKIFSSLLEAGEDLKINSSIICNQLKGRQKTAKGYTFKYL